MTDDIARQLAQQEEYRVRDTDGPRTLSGKVLMERLRQVVTTAERQALWAADIADIEAEARNQGREGIADSGVFNTTTAGALEAERQSELLGSALAFLRQFVSQDDNALTPGWYERQGRIVEATRRFLDAYRALGAAPESRAALASEPEPETG